MSTPTQRSLKRLREAGWTVAITEHWNPFARRRVDLYGFIDLLCFRGNEMLAVQTTSGSNVSARLAKMAALPAAHGWVASGTRRLVIHGWAKRGPRGKAKKWDCREVEVTPFNLNFTP